MQFAPINADGSLGSWQNTTPFNTGWLVFSSVVYNGYLYVIQGFQYSAAFPLTDVQVAAVNADGTLGPWQNTTSFAPGRWGHKSIAYNQYLYTMGGCNWNGSYYTLGDAQYSSINVDGTLNAWQGTTALEPTRDSFGLVQYGGNLIITGGFNTAAYYHYVQYAATNADGSLGPWLRMTSFNKARGNHTSVIYNGYLYVIGGADNTGTDFSDVQYAKINEQSQPAHAVTFVESTGGTISGSLYQVVTDGEDCAQVTAVPDTGCDFVNWTGTGGFVTTTDNPLTVTNVTADMAITANFTINTYTVTFVPGSNGTLAGITPQTVNYGNNCTAVEAVPNTGYQFVNWTGTNGFVTSTDNPLTVSNVTADMTITANFLYTNLTGRVTDSGNNGIANLNVNVYDLNQTFVKSGTTDSNGDYVVPDLTAGSYKVFFDGASAGNYLSEWYDDKGAFEAADVLTLDIDHPLQGIDAQLTEGGIISGQVTNESSEGIENVQVVVRDLNQGWIDSATTDATGNYSIQRLAGSYYKVNFNTNSAVGMYVGEWYNDKLRFNLDPIQVTAGVTTPLSVVLEAGGNAAGRVVNQAQDGIRNVQVMVKDLANLNRATAYTDANGNYLVVGLPVGDYKVYFNTLYSNLNYIAEWYADKNSFKNGDMVTVTLGNTTQVNAELAAGSSISGTVTDESAQPLEWVEVYVYDTGGQYYGGVYTDSSGHYQVNGVPAGNYKVNFYPYELGYYAVEWFELPRNYNYRYEWYNDQPSFITAGVVPVALESPTTGIDAVLTENCGIIAGRITDGTGNGLAGCIVYAFPSQEEFDWYYPSGNSDAEGNYQIKGLPPGNYIVWFTQPANSFYRRQFYNNIWNVEQASPAAVMAGQTTTGIDAVLLKGGIITGRVTDSNGKGIGNVLVRPIDASTNQYIGWTTGNATTDAWGYYTINVRAGTWKTMFQANGAYGGYRSEYYNDTTAVENAASFTVNPEQTVAGIDAVLSGGGGTLSGYVKNPAGTGLANAGIEVYDTQYNMLWHPPAQMPPVILKYRA